MHGADRRSRRQRARAYLRQPTPSQVSERQTGGRRRPAERRRPLASSVSGKDLPGGSTLIAARFPLCRTPSPHDGHASRIPGNVPTIEPAFHNPRPPAAINRHITPISKAPATILESRGAELTSTLQRLPAPPIRRRLLPVCGVVGVGGGPASRGGAGRASRGAGRASRGAGRASRGAGRSCGFRAAVGSARQVECAQVGAPRRGWRGMPIPPSPAESPRRRSRGSGVAESAGSLARCRLRRET